MFVYKPLKQLSCMFWSIQVLIAWHEGDRTRCGRCRARETFDDVKHADYYTCHTGYLSSNVGRSRFWLHTRSTKCHQTLWSVSWWLRCLTSLTSLLLHFKPFLFPSHLSYHTPEGIGTRLPKPKMSTSQPTDRLALGSMGPPPP